MKFNLFQKLDFNKAVFYSLALRVWQLLTGPITLFFIAHFFSAAQQGFFYTFNSILLLQIFFEMGLSFVLIQFTSHEFAFLSWGKFGSIKGGARIKRFKQLVIKSFQWYLGASVLFLIFILPAGEYFLGIKDAAHFNFHWRLPWALLVCATTLNLIMTPLLAVIEGSGRVQEVYRLRFAQNIAATIVSWLVILLGGGLFNAASIALTNAMVSLVWLAVKNPVLARLAFSMKAMKTLAKGKLLSWQEEVWPMQWRIAISWISGYFINQIFVPILFYYHDPVVAGQMGMSLSLSTMIVFIGQAWLNTKAPFLGRLVATKDWLALDQMFYKIFWQSTWVVLLACIGMIGIVSLGQSYAIFHRILPPWQLSFLAVNALLAHWVNCVAQYLRSHKREPFMLVSVIGAVFIASSAWFFGKYYASAGIVIAMLVINVVYGVPSAVWMWLKYQKAWHN